MRDDWQQTDSNTVAIVLLAEPVATASPARRDPLKQQQNFGFHGTAFGEYFSNSLVGPEIPRKFDPSKTPLARVRPDPVETAPTVYACVGVRPSNGWDLGIAQGVSGGNGWVPVTGVGWGRAANCPKVGNGAPARRRREAVAI